MLGLPIQADESEIDAGENETFADRGLGCTMAPAHS
jgi:hypothetical protein